MSITFIADEIYEMAEQIERNGAKFYRKAAESAKCENKELLLHLAQMEDDHEKTFAAMRAELPAGQRFPTTFDPEGQDALYLQALADGKVFDTGANPADGLTGKETMQEILRTAIGLEKDSIIFYLGMEDMVPLPQGKDRINRIIAEERSHIVTLSKELASVSR